MNWETIETDQWTEIQRTPVRDRVGLVVGWLVRVYEPERPMSYDRTVSVTYVPVPGWGDV